MSILLIPFSIIYKPFQFLFLITRDVLTYLFENCFQKRKRKLEIHPSPNKLALPYTVYEIQVTSFALLAGHAFTLPSKHLSLHSYLCVALNFGKKKKKLLFAVGHG